MKSISKKITMMLLAFTSFACMMFGGLSVLPASTAQAASTLEDDFTNGQFAVSDYNGVGYDYVDSGLPTGYNGSVLRIVASGGTAFAKVDFTSSKILAAGVESIVVRAYSPNYTADDEFRTLSNAGALRQYGAGAHDFSSWCDVTLTAQSIADMTDENGYLTSISLGLRDKGTISQYFYVDSITVNMKQTTKVSFNTLHDMWNNYAYDNAGCTFIQFHGGISGNGDLDANFTDLLSKMTLNGAPVDQNNFKFYCPNWIGASGGIIMRVATNPAAGSKLVFPAGVKFTIGGTDTNLYEISETVTFLFNGTKWELTENDSTVTPDEPDVPAEYEMATFTGVYAIGDFNTASTALLTYSSAAAWDAANTGNLVSKITFKNSKTGESVQATDGNVSGWAGQRWINVHAIPTGYDVIEIAEGGNFGGAVEIPALTLYNVNGRWVTSAPQAATTNFNAIAGGWNNTINGGLGHTILSFDVNPLGDAADAKNLAASCNRTSMMVKYNGTPFADLYATKSTNYQINYAHGKGYFYFAIPEADLVEGATLEIDEGTPFMNNYLGATKFVLTNGAWVHQVPVNYNPDFVGISPSFNNDTNGFLVVQFDTTGWAQGAVPTSYSGFTFNGNDISDLIASSGGFKFFQNHSLWFTYSSTAKDKLVSGYNGYRYPTIHIAEGATVEYEGNTYTFHELTLYLVDGKWTTEKPQVTMASFVGAWSTLGDFNNESTVLLQYSCDGTWNHKDLGDLASKITMRNSETGETASANEATLVGWEGQKWIVVRGLAGYDVLEIAAGGTFGGNIEIPALTLYNVNGGWVTSAPQEATTNFKAIAGGWNNDTTMSNSLGQTILSFDVNPLGDAADAKNLAASINATSMMVKYNGKTFAELYATNTSYSISYAHGNGYFYFAIPKADLVEGATLEIEDGTPFMNNYLGATKFVLTNGAWVQEVEVNYTPDYVSIGQMNHSYNETLGSYGLDLVFDTLGFAAPNAQVMAKAFTGITLNGEGVKPAFWGGEKLLFWLPKAKCESGYNGYKYATLVIEEGATVTNEKDEVFTLGGVTLYLVDGKWTTEEPVILETTFVGVQTAYGWNNNTANGIASTLLEFGDTLGTAADATNQAADTSFDASRMIKLNGKTVNEWYLEDGKTAVNYQHGGTYLQIQIPESYLEMSTAEYPYLTLTIEEGTGFMDYSLPAVTLYCVNGYWVKEQPGSEATVNFKGIANGWNNAIADGVSNNIFSFDVNPLGDAVDATNVASKAVATSAMVKYNGRTFLELYLDTTNANHAKYSISYAHGNNHFYFAIPEADLKEGAILEIDEGTPFMNHYLPALKFVLVGGAWVQQFDVNYNPDFVGISPSFNNDTNGFLVVQFDTTGWAQAAVPTSYSGFTFNGNDISDLVASNGGFKFYENHSLWFTYSSSTASSKLVAGYNGYSHPTIHVAEGATVEYEGNTYTFQELTLYLVNDKWTTEQPDGYGVFSAFTGFHVTNVGTHNHYYDEAQGFYRLTLDFSVGGLAFNKYASAVSGITYNGAPVTSGGSPKGGEVQLVTLDSGLWIWYTEEQATAGYKYYTHPTIHFEQGATVTDANGVTVTYAESTLYLVNGTWTTEKPDGWSNERILSFTEIKWNNIEYSDISKDNNLTNGAVILIAYNELLADDNGQVTNVANIISADSSVGNNIKINGVPLKNVAGSHVALHAGYLYIYVPVCEVLTIEEGTEIYGTALKGSTFYFNGQWSTEEPSYNSVQFDSIAWNNFDYNGYGSIYGQESSTGTPSNGFCGLFKYSDNLGVLNSGGYTTASDANMASAYLDIGTKLKVNGVSAKDIEGAYISYNAGQEYVYFYVPFSGLAQSDVYTVTIEDGTIFMNAKLAGTTHYFYAGEFHNEEPVIVKIQYGESFVSRIFTGSVDVDGDYISLALSDVTASVYPIAWMVNDVEYFAGDVVTVSSTATVIVTDAVDFETTYGASVRITNDGNYGIRFESRVELESFNALIAKYGETNVKTGTYIAPKALFDRADGMSIAEYFAQEQGTGNDSKYVNVSNFDVDKNKNGIFNKETYEEDGYVQYYGALTNLQNNNYYTQFFGVGYITITMGERVVTVYGLNNVAKTNRTIYDVARMAYSDTNVDYSEDAVIVLKQYIDSVAVLTYSNGNLFADTQVTGREYESAYTVSVDGGMYVITSAVEPRAVIINGRKIAFEVDSSSGIYTFEISAEYVEENFGSSLKYGIGEPSLAVWGDGTDYSGNEMLAGVAGELGVTSYRVWVNGNMGSAGAGNVVTLGAAHVNNLKAHVKALVDAGINEILFANGSFVRSYTYPCYYAKEKASGAETWISYEQYVGGGYEILRSDTNAVPNPATEADHYKAWLKVQYDYYVLFAKEVKSWKTEFGWMDNTVSFYFEGINEPEFQNLIHKIGTYNNGEYTPSYCTKAELAKILTDVSYYMTLAVGDAGYITTPAFTNIDSNSGSPMETYNVYCDTLLNEMYVQINDNVAPTAIEGITPANTNDENDYFTVLNWHPYLPWFKEENANMYYGEIVTEKTWYGTTKTSAKVNSAYADSWVAWNNGMYQIAVNGGDTDSPKVFFSEFGLCDWGNQTSGNYKTMGINETLAATVFKTLLGKAGNLMFVDELTVIAFRIFDNEELGVGEGNFGFINEQGQVKEIMKGYYEIINGNDDTSSLQAVITKYFN